MSDLNLMCNVRTCRRALTGDMWVTSCSHIFCEDHAEASGKGKCKACGTPLLKRYDSVRTHANPPEDFKSMLLAGYHPDLILDIAARATAFWSYQTAQEMNFQVEFAKHTTLKADEAATEYHTNLLSLHKELKSTKQKCDAHKRELDAFGQKMQELRYQLEEKNKQIRMLQKNFNDLKLKTVGKISGDPLNVSIGRHSSQKHLSSNTDTIQLQPFTMLGDEQDNHSTEFINKNRDFSFQPIMNSASQNPNQFLSQPTQETSKFHSRMKRQF